MIRTLIVDDEQPARNKIYRFLEGDTRFEIVGQAEDGLEALEKIEELQPDLVFLDIQMPGMTGFEVLEHLDSAAAPMIVFATAYDQYAVKAFEVQALDYLLKPYDRPRFQRTLEAVTSRGEAGKSQLEALLNMVRDRPQTLTRLMIRVGNRLTPLALDQVSHIQAEEKYVRLHHGQSSSLHREPISSLAQKLDPNVFQRIHRGDMVNLSFVASLEPWTRGGYLVTMKDGKKLTLSKTYRDAFLAAFGVG